MHAINTYRIALMHVSTVIHQQSHTLEVPTGCRGN
jgi:hypothetical protein